MCVLKIDKYSRHFNLKSATIQLIAILAIVFNEKANLRCSYVVLKCISALVYYRMYVWTRNWTTWFQCSTNHKFKVLLDIHLPLLASSLQSSLRRELVNHHTPECSIREYFHTHCSIAIFHACVIKYFVYSESILYGSSKYRKWSVDGRDCFSFIIILVKLYS